MRVPGRVSSPGSTDSAGRSPSVVLAVRRPSGTAIWAIIALNPARIASTDWGPSGRGCRSIALTCARCSLLMVSAPVPSIFRRTICRGI